MDASHRAPVLDDLLSHAAWVRALARSLVADPGAAEDVVQETWVAALERPPARHENLRGWLATVVRNAVRMRGRGAGRRAARESRVARERPQAVPSSADLAERVDTQRRLAKRVLALAEPYRSTVILRFYEGLSAAEIARRTGVPAGTVRWRLKTALDELRERLDEDFGGERAAWLALVLPLARRDVALAAGSAAGAGLLQGLLAMNLGFKLALGVAVAALALFLTPAGPAVLELVRGGEPLDDTPVEVTFRPLEREAPALAPAARESERSVVASAPAEQRAPAPVAGFRLRAIEPDGAPVPGATVAFLGFPSRSIRTDANGTALVAFGEDLPFDEDMNVLTVRHPDFAPRELTSRPDASRVVELGDVVLQPAGSIEGRVFTADGRPAAGAWVIVNDRGPVRDYRAERLRRTARRFRQPVADAEGRFRLDGVPVGDVRLWAGLEGALATLSNPIEVRRGMLGSGVEITLGVADPDDFVTGQVLLPEGSPAPRARLRYEYRTLMHSGSSTFSAEEDGTFAFAYVPAGPRTLRAQDRDQRYSPVRAEGVHGGDHVILRLEENEYLELTLRGDGAPLADPKIWGFDPAHRNALVTATQVRRENGSYLVPIPPERFQLEVTIDGYDRAILGPWDGLAAPRELEVELHPLPGLRGTVTTDGEPLAGARVELYALARERTIHNGFPVRVEPRAAAATESAEDGTFDLTFREPGEYIVRASRAGLAPTEAGPFRLDPEQGRADLSLELFPGGAIEGYLRVPDGRPAGRLVAISRGDAHARTTRCEADGSFRFEHLTPGRWQVEPTEDEIVPGNDSTATDSAAFRESEIPWNCEVREGETTRFDLDEGPPTTVVLEGTLAIDGQGAEGWTATLIPRSELQRLRTQGPETALDASGAFHLSADEPGDYRLSIIAPGEGRLVTTLLTLPAGLTEWSASFETGELRLSGVAPPSPERMDLLLAERDGFAFLCALTPEGDTPLHLAGLPAGPCRLKRYTRGEIREQDPVTSGTTLLRVEVRAGALVEARMP